MKCVNKVSYCAKKLLLYRLALTICCVVLGWAYCLSRDRRIRRRENRFSDLRENERVHPGRKIRRDWTAGGEFSRKIVDSPYGLAQAWEVASHRHSNNELASLKLWRKYTTAIVFFKPVLNKLELTQKLRAVGNFRNWSTPSVNIINTRLLIEILAIYVLYNSYDVRISNYISKKALIVVKFFFI